MSGKKGELVFDLDCPPTERQMVAAKTIANQFRIYKARREMIRMVVAAKPKKEAAHFAARWMLKVGLCTS